MKGNELQTLDRITDEERELEEARQAIAKVLHESGRELYVRELNARAAACGIPQSRVRAAYLDMLYQGDIATDSRGFVRAVR